MDGGALIQARMTRPGIYLLLCASGASSCDACGIEVSHLLFCPVLAESKEL